MQENNRKKCRISGLKEETRGRNRIRATEASEGYQQHRRKEGRK